ncbi:MAG TPA: MarR family transcriptional regulator, partial [Polyangia bacterium]|nr:MarR family transcriptional regulator [Polyangia bacterium]
MFDSCLYFNTTALGRLLERQWAAAFAHHGLTPPQ